MYVFYLKELSNHDESITKRIIEYENEKINIKNSPYKK
jgi:hypothetical protein